MMIRRAHLATLLLVLFAGGCVSPVTTRVSATGPGLAPAAQLAFAVPEDDAPAQDAPTQAAIEAALQARGYRVVDDGAYLIDFGVADRMEALGVDAQAALSPPPQRKWLSSCKRRTTRLTMTVTNRKSGETLFRGSAEETQCPSKVAAGAQALVALLLDDLEQPRGTRVLKRRAR